MKTNNLMVSPHLPPLAIKTIFHDGIFLNGLRYQHAQLASHIGAEAMLFHSDESDAIAVYIGSEQICTATVQDDFLDPTERVGREVMVLSGFYNGASGVVIQVTHDHDKVVYYVRLYGGDEQYSYDDNDLIFVEG